MEEAAVQELRGSGGLVPSGHTSQHLRWAEARQTLAAPGEAANPVGVSVRDERRFRTCLTSSGLEAAEARLPLFGSVGVIVSETARCAPPGGGGGGGCSQPAPRSVHRRRRGRGQRGLLGGLLLLLLQELNDEVLVLPDELVV